MYSEFCICYVVMVDFSLNRKKHKKIWFVNENLWIFDVLRVKLDFATKWFFLFLFQFVIQSSVMRVSYENGIFIIAHSFTVVSCSSRSSRTDWFFFQIFCSQNANCCSLIYIRIWIVSVLETKTVFQCVYLCWVFFILINIYCKCEDTLVGICMMRQSVSFGLLQPK